MQHQMNFGDTPSASELREERIRLGISQANLARVTHISQVRISQWELGSRELSKAEIETISSAIEDIREGTFADEFLFRNYQSNRKEKPDASRNQPRKKQPTGSRNHHPSPEIVEPTQARSVFDQGVDSGLPRPRFVACFAGGGGFTEGFTRAGFDVAGYVEIDEDCHETLRRNFPAAKFLASDISKVFKEQAHQWLGALGEIDVIVGGPPCQGFSLTGKRDVNDARNQLFRHYIAIAESLQPKIVVMENVRTMLNMKSPSGRRLVDEVIDMFGEAGYEVAYKVLNAKDYGVPQSRSRVFFIASNDSRFSPSSLFPPVTHSDSGTQLVFGNDTQPLVTFRDATRDLEDLESGEHSKSDPYHWAVNHPEHVLEWLRDVPEGMSAHENIDPAKRPPSGYNTTYKRLRWDEPSSTVSTTFGMISGSRNVHPSSTRSMTIREAVRCQTFPDDYRFAGTWGSVRTQIGNAVPPKLAEAIAKRIRTAVFAEQKIKASS